MPLLFHVPLRHLLFIRMVMAFHLVVADLSYPFVVERVDWSFCPTFSLTFEAQVVVACKLPF